jgi:tetratricopeptide (TPR) repeat protein
MTGDPKPRQELIRSRCSTHNFLLSKTDSAQKKKARGRISATGLATVAAQFSETAHGETFLQRAAAFIEKMDRFEALAIRIDHFLREVTDGSGDPMRGIQQAVAAAVDRVSREAGGLWGILDEDVFGCFLCNGAECEGKKWAARIRAAMAEHSGATISVGIAAYPSLDYERSHILENALKALDHAAFFGPDTDVCFDAVSLNISGDQLYQNGDISGAADEYRLALRLDPSNVNVLNSLGVCYGLMEEHEKALEAFASASRLAKGEVMPVYNAGVIHMLKGESDAALAQFRIAGEKEPDIFEVAFQTGRIYLESGAPEKGVPHLKKALALNTDAAAAHRMLGEALEKTGDEDGAVEAYQSAVKKNPNDAAALSALGSLFDRRGENPEIAELFCRQSTQIEPENGLYAQRLGELYLRHEQFEEAMQAFEKAQALGTDCSALMAGAAQSDQN